METCTLCSRRPLAVRFDAGTTNSRSGCRSGWEGSALSCSLLATVPMPDDPVHGVDEDVELLISVHLRRSQFADRRKHGPADHNQVPNRLIVFFDRIFDFRESLFRCHEREYIPVGIVVVKTLLSAKRGDV